MKALWKKIYILILRFLVVRIEDDLKWTFGLKVIRVITRKNCPIRYDHYG